MSERIEIVDGKRATVAPSEWMTTEEAAASLRGRTSLSPRMPVHQFT
jgi:hypothetical protein